MWSIKKERKSARTNTSPADSLQPEYNEHKPFIISIENSTGHSVYKSNSEIVIISDSETLQIKQLEEEKPPQLSKKLLPIINTENCEKFSAELKIPNKQKNLLDVLSPVTECHSSVESTPMPYTSTFSELASNPRCKKKIVYSEREVCKAGNEDFS